MFKYVVPRIINVRVAVALTIVLIASSAAVAQSPIGPRPLPPPTYPGNVPLSIIGFERSQYSSGFNFTFTVDIAEVQKFLPAGYAAVPSTTGGTTTNVVAIFGHGTLLTLNNPVGDFAAGTYGPYETFDLAVACFTPPGSAVGFETVFISRFVNDTEIADIINATNGHASVRLADIEVRVKEGFGELRMKGKVEDLDFGLKIAASLTGPAEIATQLRHGTFIPGVPALGLRFVDTTVSPPTLDTLAFYTGSAEFTATLTDPAALDVSEKQVRLAGGKMKILGAMPGSFFLNQENLLKMSPF